MIDKHIKALVTLNVESLLELKAVLLKLGESSYTDFNSKGQASVGQHVRHTLAFYHCLFQADETVNYDKRERDVFLETNVDHAISSIEEIVEQLRKFDLDRPIALSTQVESVSHDSLVFNSSLSRELFYVLEHAIHHMAIMRILIMDQIPNFELSPSFGVAYSTLAYREQVAKG